MQWKLPPIIKIYEALGALGDGRVRVSGNSASVSSSSGRKSYRVDFDPASNSIMANDNGSYWQGYLGYPSMAFLMATGRLKFDRRLTEALKNIPWKDINTKFKNDYEKTGRHVSSLLSEKGIGPQEERGAIDDILRQVKALAMNMLGKKIKPPSGY